MSGAELLSFWVDGIPATQGSKTPNRGGFGFHESDKKLPAWRKAVHEMAETLAPSMDLAPFDFPLLARLDVYLPAPKKSKFGRFPAGPPDLDKLQRAVGDAMKTAGLIKDDSRIVAWRARKHWAEEGTSPGARIQLEDLRDELYRDQVLEEMADVLEDLPEPIQLEAREFSVDQALGGGNLKFRGVVPMTGGQLQEVELTVGSRLAGLLRDGMLGGISIQAPGPSMLTDEAYARMRTEVERRYGKGAI